MQKKKEYIIEYTSSDGNKVEPYSGATTPFMDGSSKNIPIISNTYENGKGIIKLQKECKRIGDYAFSDCTKLNNISIPNSVTEIDDGTFYNCSSLTGITIPDKVTSIGDHAFRDCSSLTGITIPDSVTSIGEGAFSGCTSLTGIAIPNSVTSIGERAFRDCSSLTGITIPESVTSIGEGAFWGCTSLVGITIPNLVTFIGKNAFRNCSSLTGITIPDSVTTIGQGAFAYWTGATSTDIIHFPNEQLKIKYFESGYSFYNWESLTSVTIPDKVTKIGIWAFCRCTKLSKITVLPETPPTLGSNAFYDIASNAVIYVPSGSVDVYKSATNWSTYANKIQAIS